MTTHWVITIEYGTGEGHRFEPLTQFAATHEEARRRLYTYACEHKHRESLRQRSRHVFRQDEHTYYVQVRGAVSGHHLRYRLAELVWSTEKALLPDPRPQEPQDAVPDDPWHPPAQ
ncbi:MULTISPECIES: hypothetical protein [unclassified Streptomyces]|uniref:hypothetical protein n=1 Tax=unclassified Streptomyces TaxID=2593676 RepID=UPI000DBAB686|nr:MULTISPECIES: hypothetical protein [unclassified Streptomyces]MYT74196.1 hypothetical protein [Streptomyces sp. SID8367]RAJ89614.1 hypothetical protein K377_01740 [Streptomyces sp. PsTaAH-137]